MGTDEQTESFEYISISPKLYPFDFQSKSLDRKRGIVCTEQQGSSILLYFGSQHQPWPPGVDIRDFKIGHYGRLGRLDAYKGDLRP